MAALALVTIMVVTTGGDHDSTPSGKQAQELNGNPTQPPNATETPTRAASPPKPKLTSSPAPLEPNYSSDEISDAAFLMQLAASAPSFATYPDEQLTALGRAICGDLGDGFDPYGLAFQLAGGFDAEEVEAAGLVGAAMGAYCPQHVDQW